MSSKFLRRSCLKCGKPAGLCTCSAEEVCPRCLLPVRKCACERSLREERYENDEDRYQLDEEVEDELMRQYPQQERSMAYWHGFNSARRAGKRGKLFNCPYQGDARKEFYQGVSDARFRMN